jgi:hypothetical protein
LFRGDGRDGPVVPQPAADPSYVRHILYLDGAGRATPYLSTTESREVADYFARKGGQTRQTTVKRVQERELLHISQSELLQQLRGKGKGRGTWNNAYEVMQARKYVEQWLEHLLSFETRISLNDEELRRLVNDVFEGSKGSVT